MPCPEGTASMARTVGMALVVWLARLLYRACCLFPQRRKIVLLSRQAARPLDFALLVPELSRRFPDRRIVWCCVAEIGRMSVSLMVRQIWHVATAELCLVDGYVPAVSLPKRHRSRVVQVWHALGAIKKFGYQALDTPAGRPSRIARELRMHRGYDLVIAGLPGAVPVFSEAFDVPEERIAALGLPRVDYLRSPLFAERRRKRFTRADRVLAEAFVRYPEDVRERPLVLYAPTFRKANADEHWLAHAVDDLRQALAGANVRIAVAGHPLEHAHDEAGEAGAPVAFVHGVATIDLLHAASYVVTDYSTVAFEAGFAEKPVLFYVPDIEEYRLSPGLNVDPLRDLPTLSSQSAAGLAPVIAGEKPYDAGAFRAFMEWKARGVDDGAIERIADLLEVLLGTKGDGGVSCEPSAV